MGIQMPFSLFTVSKSGPKYIFSVDTCSELLVSNSYLILLCRPFVLLLFNDEKYLFERALTFQAS